MSGNDTRLDIQYGDLTEKNIGQLKILNASILPVRYNAKFYSDLLQNSIEYSKLVYHADILVGAVCCRIENQTGANGKPNVQKLYIMTFGVLSPYRKLGIGSALLNFVFKVCKDRPAIEAIYLHVQTSNEEAILFYKKFGFEIVETIENYYKRIDPPHCHVLQKMLNKE